MTFRPDKTSKVPLYRQVGDYLISQIVDYPQDGECLLLPEREMSCAYGVSRSTIRQALRYVEERHFVTRRQGNGTFIAERAPATSLMQLFSFSKEMLKEGKVPSSKILSLEIITDCGKLVQQSLELKTGEQVYLLKRLRYGDDQIEMFETTYLPCSLVPGLSVEILTGKSLYTILRERYHIVPDEARQEFEAAGASREEAKLLNVDYGEPVMLATRISHCNGQTVEYSKCLIPRGTMRYSVELKL